MISDQSLRTFQFAASIISTLASLTSLIVVYVKAGGMKHGLHELKQTVLADRDTERKAHHD